MCYMYLELLVTHLKIDIKSDTELTIHQNRHLADFYGNELPSTPIYSDQNSFRNTEQRHRVAQNETTIGR